ncbi:MAG: carbohydrate ABC transporter permease [Clostridiales bacterium]|jgi:putative aldouronate transport system permease protein|nr:carbohydrate ABC transporter permease [Clostridiales bacterium]
MIQSRSETIFQVAINICLSFMVLMVIIPIWLLIAGSFTDDSALISGGYGLFPKVFSLSAYEYLMFKSKDILNALGISFFITTTGTAASLIITPLLAYPLSRKDFTARNAVSFFVFFTMLFNGGIVPSYMMWTQFFKIKNTVWALMIPNLLMNGFSVIMMKNYFAQNIPAELIEAAKIDGGGEFYIFYKVVLPLSLPIMATIGLLTAIGFWNDWTNGLYYVNDSRFFSLQNLLNRILTNVQFLASSTEISQRAVNMKLPSVSIRMAIAVVGVTPIMALYPFFQKYFVKGITIGAVKG